jgi:hypothetical protein
MANQAAAHVPLPKITMSNSPSNRRFHATFQRNTARVTRAREPAWARVIGVGAHGSQTLKSREMRFFCAACGRVPVPYFGRQNRSQRPLHMGRDAILTPPPRFSGKKTLPRPRKALWAAKNPGRTARPGRPSERVNRVRTVRRPFGAGRPGSNRSSGCRWRG